jgi:selenide, water dikinase
VQALSALPKRDYPELLVGTSTLDDAGVVRISEDLALVQTLDFFPPIVDDPIYFGRIAAANALSDVYSMGGTPFTAMGIVGWPSELPLELLGQIFVGGQEKIDEAGAMLVGGHSVRDAEIKYGLSVTGRIHPDRILTNAGAKAGDVLVLTKPIGMGTIATGIKKGKVGEELARRAMDCMATLNKGGAEAALAVGVDAMTDVTGFGLGGHAIEMAHGSGLAVEIDLDKVPVFESAYELACSGLVSGGAKRTRSYLGDELLVGGGLDFPLVDLCLDAETSGGLLISVAQDRVDELIRELEGRKTPAAAVIGRFLPKGEHSIILR